jgi:hypothetical protein
MLQPVWCSMLWRAARRCRPGCAAPDRVLVVDGPIRDRAGLVRAGGRPWPGAHLPIRNVLAGVFVSPLLNPGCWWNSSATVDRFVAQSRAQRTPTFLVADVANVTGDSWTRHSSHASHSSLCIWQESTCPPPRDKPCRARRSDRPDRSEAVGANTRPGSESNLSIGPSAGAACPTQAPAAAIPEDQRGP